MTFAHSVLRGQPIYKELAERCRAQSIRMENQVHLLPIKIYAA